MAEQTLHVKSGLKPKADGSDPVALFERDPRHPGGEAFVAGDNPAEVAPTPEVVKRIRDGVLVEVPAPKEPDGAAQQPSAARQPATDELPADLPHRDDLLKAGITRRSQVARMSDASLVALPGIGKAGVADLRKVIPYEGQK